MANDDEPPISPQEEATLGSGRTGEPVGRSKVYRPVLPGNVASELQQSINQGHPNLHSPNISPPNSEPQGAREEISPPPPVAPKPSAPHGSAATGSGGEPGVGNVPPPVAPKPVLPEASKDDEDSTKVDPSQTGHFLETFVDQSVSLLSIDEDERLEEDLTQVEIHQVNPRGGEQVGDTAGAVSERHYSEAKEADGTSTGSSSRGVPVIKVDDFGEKAEPKKGSVRDEDGLYHTIGEEENMDSPTAINSDHLTVYNALYSIGSEEGETSDDSNGGPSGYEEEESEAETLASVSSVGGGEQEVAVDYHQEYEEDDVFEDEEFPQEEEEVVEEPESYLGFFSRKLKAELNQLKKDGGPPGGDGEEADEGLCFRCRKELGFIFDSGEICPKCKGKVCKECQVFTPSGKKWLCKYCDKQLQIKINSPDWVGSKSNEDLSHPAIHGTQLVKISLENSRANSTVTSIIDENEKRFYEDDLSYSDEESESFGSEEYRRSPGRNVTFESPLRQSTIPSDLGLGPHGGAAPTASSRGTKHWHARSQGWGPSSQFCSTGHNITSSSSSEHFVNRHSGDGHSQTHCSFCDTYDFTVTHKVATIKRTDEFSQLAPPFVWSGDSRPQANSIDSGASLTCSSCSNEAAEDDIENRSGSDYDELDGSGGLSSDDEGTPVNASTQTGDDLSEDIYLDGTVQEVEAPVDFSDYVVLDRVEEAFIFCNSDSHLHPRHNRRKLTCDLVGHDAEMKKILERESPDADKVISERRMEWNFLPKFYPKDTAKEKKKLVPSDRHIFVPVDRAHPLPQSEQSSSSESSPLIITDDGTSSSGESVVDLDERFSENVSFVQSLLSESRLSGSKDDESIGVGGTKWEGETDEGDESWATEGAVDSSENIGGSEDRTTLNPSLLSNRLPPQRKLLKAPTLNFADFGDFDDEGSAFADDEDFFTGPDPFYLANRLQASSESDLSVILEDPEEDCPNNKTVSEESEVDEEGPEADRYYKEDRRDYSKPHPGERVPVDVHPNGQNGLYMRNASPTPKRVIDTTPRLRGDEWEQMLNGKLKDASSLDGEYEATMEEKEIKPVETGMVASAVVRGGVGVNNNEGEDQGLESLAEERVENGDDRIISEAATIVEGTDGEDMKQGAFRGTNGVEVEWEAVGQDDELTDEVMVEVVDLDDSDMVVISYGEAKNDDSDVVEGRSPEVERVTDDGAPVGYGVVADAEGDHGAPVGDGGVADAEGDHGIPVGDGVADDMVVISYGEAENDDSDVVDGSSPEVERVTDDGAPVGYGVVADVEGDHGAPVRDGVVADAEGNQGIPVGDGVADDAGVGRDREKEVEVEVYVVQPREERPAATGGAPTLPGYHGTQTEFTGDDHVDVAYDKPYEVPGMSSTLPASAGNGAPLGLEEDGSETVVRRSNSAVEAKLRKNDMKQSLAVDMGDTIPKEEDVEGIETGMMLSESAGSRVTHGKVKEGGDVGNKVRQDLNEDENSVGVENRHNEAIYNEGRDTVMELDVGSDKHKGSLEMGGGHIGGADEDKVMLMGGGGDIGVTLDENRNLLGVLGEHDEDCKLLGVTRDEIAEDAMDVNSGYGLGEVDIAGGTDLVRDMRQDEVRFDGVGMESDIAAVVTGGSSEQMLDRNEEERGDLLKGEEEKRGARVATEMGGTGLLVKEEWTLDVKDSKEGTVHLHAGREFYGGGRKASLEVDINDASKPEDSSPGTTDDVHVRPGTLLAQAYAFDSMSAGTISGNSDASKSGLVSGKMDMRYRSNSGGLKDEKLWLSRTEGVRALPGDSLRLEGLKTDAVPMSVTPEDDNAHPDEVLDRNQDTSGESDQGVEEVGVPVGPTGDVRAPPGDSLRSERLKTEVVPMSVTPEDDNAHPDEVLDRKQDTSGEIDQGEEEVGVPVGPTGDVWAPPGDSLRSEGLKTEAVPMSVTPEDDNAHPDEVLDRNQDTSGEIDQGVEEVGVSVGPTGDVRAPPGDSLRSEGLKTEVVPMSGTPEDDNAHSGEVLDRKRDTSDKCDQKREEVGVPVGPDVPPEEIKVDLKVGPDVALATAESLSDEDFLIAALDRANTKTEIDMDVNVKITRDAPPSIITKSRTLPYRKRATRTDSHSKTMGPRRSTSDVEGHNEITDDDEAHRTSTASLYSNAEESYRLPITGDVNFGTNYNYKTNTFEVKILSCRDLHPVDAKRNRSNAYVKLYLLPDRTKQSKRKSSVKKGTINPVFSETLKYKIMQSELETRTLCVAVWHYDRFGHNLFLGEHLLSLDTIQFDEYLARWHPLAQRQRNSTSALTYTGDVLVAIMYEPLSETEEQDQGGHYTKGRRNKAPGRMLGGTLNVQVKEAKNLVGSKMGGAPSPACKCYLLPDRSRNGKKKTASKKSTCNPTWSDILRFENVTRDSLLERCLEVTVWDYDTVGSNSHIGGVRLGLGSGKSYGKAVNWMDSSGKEVSVWREMLKHPNHWVETFMTLRGNVGKVKK